MSNEYSFKSPCPPGFPIAVLIDGEQYEVAANPSKTFGDIALAALIMLNDSSYMIPMGKTLNDVLEFIDYHEQARMLVVKRR